MTRMRSTGRIRRLGALVAFGLGLLVAGCATESGLPTPPLQAAAPSNNALAFEPVTGVPGERAAVLAEELATVAVARELAILPAEEAARFRVKGYFSAVRRGSTTEVNFVWDIFEADGTRVHRVSGTETVQAGLPDPWQAVTDDALRRIARRTVEELDAWLSRGAPARAETAAAPSREGSGSRAGITGTTALIGAGPRIPVDSTPGNGLRATMAALPPAPRFTFFLPAVAGATSDGPEALAVALASILEDAGGARVARAADADYLVSGEATVAPADGASQAVAIVWTIKRGNGESLGTVRQINQVGAGRLDPHWGEAADLAARAAAPGIVALIAGR